jgi:hypothetical protein
VSGSAETGAIGSAVAPVSYRKLKPQGSQHDVLFRLSKRLPLTVTPHVRLFSPSSSDSEDNIFPARLEDYL